MQKRIPTHIKRGYWTQDGAGVKLNRVLGADDIDIFDPILMLDSFDSDNPDDYTAGFPTHPHRGIETISYVREGAMQHADSLGFSDTVRDGGIQWMCAGSGVLHSEKIPAAKRLLGVQLWLNLPQKDKMCSPSYTAVSANSIKSFSVGSASTLRLLAGRYTDADGAEHTGHLSEHLPFDYYEISLAKGDSLTLAIEEGKSAMAFTLLGSLSIGDVPVDEKCAIKLSDGDIVELMCADEEECTLLVMVSEELHEPVAWAGPIVMNTDEELKTAFQELQAGTFIKEGLDVNHI